MELRKLDIVLLFLFLLLVIFNGLLIYQSFFSPLTKKEIEVFSAGGIVLPEKPSLQGYISNSDLLFSGQGFLSLQDLPNDAPQTLLQNKMGWDGDAWWSEQIEKIEGREGFLVSHPLDKTHCRWVETPEFTLPNDGYIIMGLANGEGKLSYTGGNPEIGDNVFKIYLVDIEKNIKFPLDSITISSKDGWKDMAYKISDLDIFKGSKVKVRVENCAGGELHLFWGEWGVIDYIDIIS